MAKGGKTTKLVGAGAGGAVDTSDYGPISSVEASVLQPFWDEENYDPNSVSFEDPPLGIDGELYAANPWDVVSLNGHKLPGIWEASATPAIQLDVQKPNGFDGAALVSRGYVNAGITLTGQIWTPRQWALFQRLLPTFWAPPNHYLVNDQKRQKGQIVGTMKAVVIDHPGLQSLNIGAIVINKITPPEKTGDWGVRQIKITAVQYVAPPLVKASAVKKAAGAGVDRTVQAQKIQASHMSQQQAAAMGIASVPDASIANVPKLPSLSASQVRGRLPPPSQVTSHLPFP